MTRHILISLSIVFISLLIFWCGGVDFSYRNFQLGAAIFVAVILGIISLGASLDAADNRKIQELEEQVDKLWNKFDE